MSGHNWSVTLASLLAIGALAWCFMSPQRALPASPVAVVEHMANAAPPPTDAPPRVEPRPMRAALATNTALLEPAYDNSIGMPSHPLTAEHKRIFRENNLVGDLNGAMDVADVSGLRERLKQYREEYPEDAHVLQDGYELIANCLEQPGPETRAAAQKYYDEELASGLRRYIRRHCLQ